MEPQLIRSLVPYEPARKFKIRVTKTIGADPQAASLDSVFVDKELNVGCTYEINKFRVIRNRTSSKIVPHNVMIELNKWTTIVPVERIGQVIPMQWFNLVEFDQLHKKVDRYVELTDVFCCLMALQPIEKVNVQNVRVA
ncbi:hypothetical protein DVH24_016824 [Malus domestica]|uniref:DUF223 domain-containing protein n=1 Tax=Malus domestica TaxID=3750 RepID=A0A498HVH6_MALDO|nr:hypothetical protein DVH24_016824 [Malus domestica]